MAADDLAAAKKATAVVAAMTVIHHENRVDAPPGFVQDARKFSNVDSLKDVRVVFKSFSRRAIHIAQGKPGYYDVACCLMVLDTEDDWVQMTKSISNPYPGQARAACGSIEK